MEPPKKRRKKLNPFENLATDDAGSKENTLKGRKRGQLDRYENGGVPSPRVEKPSFKEDKTPISVEQRGLNKEWTKQAQRIRDFQKRAEARGYFFPASPVPNRPSTVTETDIEKLKRLTPNELYKKAQYYDPDIGKYITGDVARRKERQKSGKRGYVTRQINELKKPKLVEEEHSDYAYGHYSPPNEALTVLENIREEIRSWSPRNTWSKNYVYEKERDKDRLESLLDDSISMFGLERVALNLQQHAEQVSDIVQDILYGSGDDKVNLRLVEFASILRGGPLSRQESEAFTDICEQVE